MKMARATFPPSRGEPAVASATDNDHKNTSLKQPRTSAAHTYDASDRRRRWRMQRVNTNKQKGHGAEQADVCKCSRWTDGRTDAGGLTFQSMVAKAVMVGCKTSFCQSSHLKTNTTLPEEFKSTRHDSWLISSPSLWASIGFWTPIAMFSRRDETGNSCKNEKNDFYKPEKERQNTQISPQPLL